MGSLSKIASAWAWVKNVGILQDDYNQYKWLQDGSSKNSLIGSYILIGTFIIVLEQYIIVTLAARQHANNIHHPRLQRACIRIMMTGPIYSILIWISLMWEQMDIYCSIPIGIYEGYAMLSFFEILVIYVGGEHKATLALTAQGERDSHSCRCYSPCAICCALQDLSQRHGYIRLFSFSNGRALYDFLKFSVAQLLVAKPGISVIMLVLSKMVDGRQITQYGYLCLLRIVNIASLLWCVHAILQMYNAILPRFRGLGGDKVFNMLTLILVIIIVQELVTIFLVLEAFVSLEASGEISDVDASQFRAIDLTSVRYLALFTIVQFTVFIHIFYRYFTPELFETGPSFLWSQQQDKSVSTFNFLIAVFSVWNIFDEHSNLRWNHTVHKHADISTDVEKPSCLEDEEEICVMETTPLMSQPRN